MVLNDTLANVMSHIMSYEKLGKKEITLNYSSKVIKKVIDVLKENHYTGTYEVEKANNGEKLRLNLLNNINRCGVIKPRYQVKKTGFEKFEKRFLPSKGFGILIISTPKGIMTNEQAKNEGVGGKLLAYCY